MALLSAQDVDSEGAAVTLAAAGATGDTFANPQERVMLRVVNAAGVARTVTIAAQSPCNHGFTHDIVQATANGETWDFGPFDRERFNQSDGTVAVTYSSETGLTVAAINVVKPPSR